MRSPPSVRLPAMSVPSEIHHVYSFAGTEERSDACSCERAVSQATDGDAVAFISVCDVPSASVSTLSSELTDL